MRRNPSSVASSCIVALRLGRPGADHEGEDAALVLLVDRRRAQQRVQPLPVGELAAERDDGVETLRRRDRFGLEAAAVERLGEEPGQHRRAVGAVGQRDEHVLVVAVGGEHDPLARELGKDVEQRVDLLERDRGGDVDAVLRIGEVEDLLALHERPEPQRELRPARRRAARC